MKRFTNLITGRALLIVVLGVLFVFPSGCSKKRSEAKEIKIGAILPLTGDAAQWGVEAKRAIELSADEINSKGDIQGKRVYVIFEDSQLSPKVGTNAIHKLISQDGVKVIIGAISSSVTLAIAPIAESNKVVLITPASTSSKITDAGDYIFRTISSEIIEGGGMAEVAFERLSFKRVSVIAVNAAGTKGMADAFCSKFKALGGEILDYELIDQGSTDFRSQLTKIKGSKHDAIYVVGFPLETGYVLKQARELGIKVQFLSAQPAEDPEVRKIARDAANGLILTTTTLDIESASEPTRIFIELFKAKFGKEPGVFSYEAYDAFQLAVKAIRKVGYDSERIKDYLYNVKDYKGVSGDLSFDVNGDVVKTIRVLRIENNKLKRFD